MIILQALHGEELKSAIDAAVKEGREKGTNPYGDYYNIQARFLEKYKSEIENVKKGELDIAGKGVPST
jgi:DNA invertase Pin-like site-specific DNA recombinase